MLFINSTHLYLIVPFLVFCFVFFVLFSLPPLECKSHESRGLVLFSHLSSPSIGFGILLALKEDSVHERMALSIGLTAAQWVKNVYLFLQMRNVPHQESNPCPLQWNPNHWTTREVRHLKSFFFFSILNNYFFGCAGSSLLCGLFSSCGEQGLLSNCTWFIVHGLLISVASLIAEPRLWSSASVVMAPTLVALWHVGPSWIRNWTRDCCIGRWILYNWVTKKTLKKFWGREC